MFSLCVCSTHETVCKFNYILCERKASRQCEKTGDTLDCFDICKRSCTDCMQRVFASVLPHVFLEWACAPWDHLAVCRVGRTTCNLFSCKTILTLNRTRGTVKSLWIKKHFSFYAFFSCCRLCLMPEVLFHVLLQKTRRFAREVTFGTRKGLLTSVRKSMIL